MVPGQTSDGTNLGQYKRRTRTNVGLVQNIGLVQTSDSTNDGQEQTSDKKTIV